MKFACLCASYIVVLNVIDIELSQYSLYLLHAAISKYILLQIVILLTNKHFPYNLYIKIDLGIIINHM